jgi:hypothetical protein
VAATLLVDPLEITLQVQPFFPAKPLIQNGITGLDASGLFGGGFSAPAGLRASSFWLEIRLFWRAGEHWVEKFFLA